jgi:hypothetical protein
LLTGLLRSGTRDLITKAVQAELAEFLSPYQVMTDNQGQRIILPSLRISKSSNKLPWRSQACALIPAPPYSRCSA